MRLTAIGISLLALAACNQQGAQNQATANAPVTTPATENVVAPESAANAADTALPAAKPSPLSEPRGPIDPKSVEAVVQHYGALIEQGRWTASRALWGNADSAKQFERNFRTYADVHVEIGDLGESEGAAGSIYVTEPVTFYGKKNGGGDYRKAAEVTLRRVNDVDGSTEAQRRWHIERIEWKAPA